MAERFRSPEQKEQIPRPHTLDVVKIDGRWAQIKSSRMVKFLDNSSIEDIDWDDYRMVKDFGGRTVGDILKFLGEALSENEIENIHWGPEAKKHPDLKMYVSAFGEYVKKR
jgi:hypothetical protein